METILRYSFIYILMLAILDHGHGEDAQGQISGEHCTTPPVNDNSTFTNWTAEVTVNATIVASCYSGYKMSGESTMKCLPNETWSAPPKCDVLQCETHPSVDNKSTFTNWTVAVNSNTTLEARCYSGYNMSGNSSITCLPNGMWSTPPTCNVIYCKSAPNVFSNSTFTNWSGDVNSNASLVASCYSGYNMSGNSTITCLPDGTWSTPPTCNVISCQTPPGVNGTSTFINWTGEVNSNATLEASCYSGYNMSGNATMKCLPNGTWSTPPTCHVIHCKSAPNVISNSTFTNWSGDINSNASLVASCYSGYNMSGNATMKCLPSGTWSTSPSCNVIQCEVPAFTNGNVQPPPPVYANKSVTFTCESGFKLIGNSTSKCNYNGSFDHVPICQLMKASYGAKCEASKQCVTKNATCNTNICVCPESHDFYLKSNDSCVTRLSLGNNFTWAFLQEKNDSVGILGVHTPNARYKYAFYVELRKNETIINIAYFNITSSGNATITFRNVPSGERYMLHVFLSDGGIPSMEYKNISVVTLPNCNKNWLLQKVTTESFTFVQPAVLDGFEYYVFDIPDVESFIINDKVCNKSSTCAFLKSLLNLNVTGLTSGLPYTILIQTAIAKGDDTAYSLSGVVCQTFNNYTVPELPNGLEIPTANIDTNSFVIQFANETPTNFVSWQVDVYNDSSAELVTSKTEFKNSSNVMTISDKIEPATKYIVHVIAVVPYQISLSKNFTFYTRPTNASPAELGHVSTNSITLVFNRTLHSVRYTHITVRVKNSTVRFKGACDSLNVNSMNCTFKTPINDTAMELSSLSPGTLYNISIFTSIGDMENIFPQVIQSYTEPNSIQSENIDIKNLSESSISVIWTRPGHVSGYNVTFRCISPNENSTIAPVLQTTVDKEEASVNGLDPGSFCNVSVQTFLNNGIYRILYGSVTQKHLQNSSHETAPREVRGHNISSIGSRAAVINWLTPSIKNGVIRNYITWIVASNNTCLEAMVWTCSDCSKSDATFNIHTSDISQCSAIANNTFVTSKQEFNWSLTTLHPYRNYIAYIAAYTVTLGTNAHLQIITLEDIPGKPVSLHNLTASAASLKLKWSPPSEQNGVVKNYTVMYTFYNRICSETGAINISTIITNSSEVMFTDIFPFWWYNISVKATNKIGTGNYTDVLQIQTNESNPDVVNTASSFSVYARNATMNWTDPCFKNGILKRFYVELLNSSSAYFMNETWASTFKTNASTHELLLMELLPFRNYSVRVKAANNAGNGTYNVSHIFMTNIDVPMAPSDLRQGSTNSSYVRINWNKTMHYTGPTKYIINVTDDNDNVPFTSFVTHEGWWIDQLATHVELFDLDAFWKYSIAVTAETSYQNQGPLRSESTKVIVLTAESVPGRLQNLSAVSELDVTKPPMLFVNWLAPIERDRNGIIVGYEIYCSNRNRKFDVSASTLSHNITMYIDNKSNVTVEVRAATSVGYGEPFTVTVEVKPGAPEVPPETPSNPLTKIAQIPVADDKKMIAVQLSKSFLCNNKTGAPVQWGVIVAQESKATDLSFVGSHGEYQTKKNIMYKKWSEVKDMDDIPPYLATGPHWSPSCIKGGNKRRRRAAVEEIEPFNFIIGSEDCSNNQEYCNGPLQPGRSYRVKSFACTSSGCTETLYSQPIKTAPDLTAAIIGGVVTAVVVMVVAGVVIFYMKRTKRLCFAGKEVENGTRKGVVEMKHIDTESEHIFKPCPVNLPEFPAYVENMHKDSNLLFADAYKLLKEKSPSYPVTAANSENSRPKNRYTNIMPYDRSRVKLRPLDDVEGSDFINANYIPGYTSRREYIATQGPMQMTFDDFWRMIWEQNVDTIVMLTRLVEKGRRKCDQYWPNLNDPVFYGDLIVSIQSESNLSDYTLRIFEVRFKKECRTVKHFWYLKWPDMGCPDDPKMLLDFVKTVREHKVMPGNGNATVVHCSAGVGRTGTYIAVDHLLQHIRDHDDVDIYQLVLDMREHRCNMVQTEDQYVYIHECLKAFITTDDETEDEEEVEPLYQNTKFGGDSIYENTAFQQD